MLAVSVLALIVIATAVGSYSSRAEAAPESESPAPEDASATTKLDATAGFASATYAAELTGDFGEDGPIARLTLTCDTDRDTVSYALEITSALANPNSAAICAGGPGESGATVFVMFAGPTIAGRFSGMVAQGEIAASDLAGPLQGTSVADLILLFEQGDAYATIGTDGVPVDALSGQIH